MIQDQDGIVHIRDETVKGLNLAGRTLDALFITNSVLEDCDFSGVKAKNCVPGGGNQHSSFIRCSFDGIQFPGTGADWATFEACSFTGVKIRNWECHTVDFIDCIWSGTWRNCQFDGAMPADFQAYLGRTHNRFHNNDLSGATLIQVYFLKGIDLTAQRLPTGSAYLFLVDAARAVAELRDGSTAWQEEEQEVLDRFLQSFDRQIAGGQQQIFERVADCTRGWGLVGEKAIAFWRSNGFDVNLTN